jgi:uncharacterized protein DUF6152
MPMKLRLCVLTIAALLCPLVQAFAHHSFAAEYDEKKVMTIKGQVTKFEWTNPHVRFYVDAKDEKGNVTNWDLELMSVNTLSRAGWDRHALKVGDQVTVTFYLAKDGSKRGNARGSVELAGGRKIFAGDAVKSAESNR